MKRFIYWISRFGDDNKDSSSRLMEVLISSDRIRVSSKSGIWSISSAGGGGLLQRIIDFQNSVTDTQTNGIKIIKFVRTFSPISEV
jgi:hypothetical protein